MKTAALVIRCFVALLFLFAGVAKFGLDPNAPVLFGQLGMEPGGRLTVGALEVIAAILLVSPRGAAIGAILGWGLMSGALIAHATILGITGMMGIMSLLALATWIGCAFILFAHRHQIDFVRFMFACGEKSEEDALRK